jgi:serine/threonine protein kinase
MQPGNIMVMAGDIVKIGDLGIAKALKHTMAAKTQIGTPHYMPPEIWKNRWAGRKGKGKGDQWGWWVAGASCHCHQVALCL